MIAGPNGSGKSTLTAELVGRGIELGEYLNADDIAKGMTGPPAEVAANAQAEVRRRRQESLDNKTDHCFETVMSHSSHIDHLRSAKEAGFTTRLLFVATENPIINEGRVANRVSHGGHDVPTDRIAARYHRCLANLPAAIAAADHCMIFDNSSVADRMRPLARIDGGFLKHLLDRFAIDEWPIWWLEILPKIKPAPYLENGPIL